MVYKWLINNLHRLIDTSCLLCGQAVQPHITNHLCDDCKQDLPTISQACAQCGIGINANFNHPHKLRCGPCLTKPPSYDRVVSAFAYADPLKQLVAHFKYQRQLAMGTMLAEILMSKVQTSPCQVEAILPVPLHPSRLRQRGFNQALELARPLARAFGLPLLLSQISRQKNTLEQSSLSGKQRRTNLNKAFILNQDIPYKSVAIVDDVMTTGSTVAELSSLLKKNGVDYIEVWCVARAVI